MGERTTRGATSVERRGDTDLVVTRLFDAEPGLVYEAWTTPELFQRWWAPRSRGMPIQSCEMDVRTGRGYRLVFALPEGRTMAFFGRYLEVEPAARLVWTNDEAGSDGAVTTVTFIALDGRTRLVLTEAYPSREALDESFVGMEDTMPEQFDQLDELLAELGAPA